jgi:hypothetical protein
MEFDWNNTTTFLFSALALGVSIYSIILTRRNLKKELRLAKLEEILEIIHFLNGYYNQIFKLFIDTEKRIELLNNNQSLPQYLLELEKYKQEFEKVVSKDIITNKVLRLRILSDAYLPNHTKKNKLKVQIQVIGDIYYTMYIFIFTNGRAIREKYDLIPRPAEMSSMATKLIMEIIHDMKLGYTSIDDLMYKDYLKNHFEQDLKDSCNIP